MNDEIYFVDVSGQDNQSLGGGIRGGGASQRVGLLTTIRPLVIDIQASLTTTNGDKVSGTSTVDGFDHTPVGWPSCGPVDSSMAGIRADSGSSITQNGGGTVLGTPPVKIDPTVTDSTFSKYGDVTYADLAARASITLPGQNFSTSIAPVVTNGQRSEEHTSELQSRLHLVCRLLLEKKKRSVHSHRSEERFSSTVASHLVRRVLLV